MTFHIMHNSDLYEVTTSGLCISRIVRYVDGSNIREETDYQSMPPQAREAVLDRIEKIWRNGDN